MNKIELLEDIIKNRGNCFQFSFGCNYCPIVHDKCTQLSNFEILRFAKKKLNELRNLKEILK